MWWPFTVGPPADYTVSPPLPQFKFETTPVVGCICPPGANRDCQAPACPRKPIPTQET